MSDGQNGRGGAPNDFFDGIADLHSAHSTRTVRSDDDEVDLIFFGKTHNGIFGFDISSHDFLDVDFVCVVVIKPGIGKFLQQRLRVMCREVRNMEQNNPRIVTFGK
jgi:hypothetical protein